MDNPFRTPTAELTAGTPQQAGTPLYKASAVGLATFFGTPLAGAWVLAYNLRQLGLHRQVRDAWIAAVVLFVLVIAVGAMLPEKVPGVPLAVVQLVVMQQYAKKLLGVQLTQHAEQQGQFYSNWRAFGISLLFLLAILVVMLAAILPFVS